MSREMKHSGIDWIGDIPKEWKVGQVKQCFYRKNEKAQINNPVVLSLARSGVKVRDISTNEGQLAESYFNYNPVEPDDLLINPMDLYSGANCSVSNVKGVISPAYINLRYIGNNNPRFFDYYFKSQYWGMALFAHGKGVSFDNRWTLNADTLLRYYIPIPPYSEQQKIADYLDKACSDADEMIALQEKMIEELKAYKQSVITEAVTKGLNPNVPMRDSGIDWIGEIPEHWNTMRFKHYFKTGKGLNITKGDLTPEGAPIVSYGQVHSKYNTGTKLDDVLIRHLPESLTEGCHSSKVSIGDFIFADTSEDINGCGNAVYVDKEIGLFAGYHSVIAFGKYSHENKFLSYLFLTDCWRSQIRMRVTGIKVFSISQNILNQTTLILPPKIEQQQIVSYLDTICSEIDSLISIKQKKIEELKDYKKSVIYEYVTGKKQVN